MVVGELVFDDQARECAQRLIELALREDLSDAGDLTSRALIDESQLGVVAVVATAVGGLVLLLWYRRR